MLPKKVIPPAGAMAPMVVVEHHARSRLPSKFMEVQKTMHDVSTKPALSFHCSGHQAFTMKMLISDINLKGCGKSPHNFNLINHASIAIHVYDSKRSFV